MLGRLRIKMVLPLISTVRPWHLNLSSKNMLKKGLLSARAMSGMVDYKFETLKVTSPGEFIKQVELNRPEKRNAMNTAFWKEIITCFNQLAVDQDCRVVILSGSGKMYTAGLDLMDNEVFTKLMAHSGDVGRKAFLISESLQSLQDSFNVIERCPKPVIAAVHNACIGGGVDMISACDIRYCTQDAWFQIKEIDLGLAADLGTLQRFPKIIGNDSLFRELTYTARKFVADEAKSMGFVSRILPDKDALEQAAVELAKVIASKSPIGVQGSKVNIVYSRDHGVEQGLNYMKAWNAAMLQSEDLTKALTAAVQKAEPVFSKL
ncbi:delta(3,5)-Delta(2,4)-dienoyl-CoA isomerase, mitochondrial-like isoform X2 [Physella acuta]|uniref:delta(3,5)-Delta(2,4)-dienoyl-CoA isomerase, mitochondrial-like isoform X2 n=1 Tax=Physella acuta TaxID=109671 RepID=UPI0027DC58BD|nr:delta(3,5)-Delta(2,4)-dienoyl-CoA isomerase, mitochondrial-like isoform X2 [Physella acuta]